MNAEIKEFIKRQFEKPINYGCMKGVIRIIRVKTGWSRAKVYRKIREMKITIFYN